MYRLLIADDERIEREVLFKILSRNLEGQCEIFQAGNGREALEIYREKKIQIAILDIEMPGINGIEAAEKIRETDRECSIIFLTAFDEFSYAKKAITVRALDYLLKPYDEQELMLVVEEAIRIAAENEAGGRCCGQRECPPGPDDGDGDAVHPGELYVRYLHAGAGQEHELLGAILLQTVQAVFQQEFHLLSDGIPGGGGEEALKPGDHDRQGGGKGRGLFGCQLLHEGVQADHRPEPVGEPVVHITEELRERVRSLLSFLHKEKRYIG